MRSAEWRQKKQTVDVFSASAYHAPLFGKIVQPRHMNALYIAIPNIGTSAGQGQSRPVAETKQTVFMFCANRHRLP